MGHKDEIITFPKPVAHSIPSSGVLCATPNKYQKGYVCRSTHVFSTSTLRHCATQHGSEATCYTPAGGIPRSMPAPFFTSALTHCEGQHCHHQLVP